MKILITGVHGFVGSNLVKALSKDAEYHFLDVAEADNENFSEGVRKKHHNKERYAKQPLFWRSLLYFCYRYFFKLGFLDGKEGFLFAYIQGWWYRTLVDANVMAVEKACGDDKEKKAYIENNWNIKL